MQTTLPLIQTTPRIPESLGDQRLAKSHSETASASFSELLSQNAKPAHASQDKLASAETPASEHRAKEKNASASADHDNASSVQSTESTESTSSESAPALVDASKSPADEPSNPQSDQIAQEAPTEAQPVHQSVQLLPVEPASASPQLTSHSPETTQHVATSQEGTRVPGGPAVPVLPGPANQQAVDTASQTTSAAALNADGSIEAPRAVDGSQQANVRGDQAVQDRAVPREAALQPPLHADVHSVSQTAAQQPIVDAQSREQRAAHSPGPASVAAASSQPAVTGEALQPILPQDQATKNHNKKSAAQQTKSDVVEPIVKEAGGQPAPALGRAHQVDAAIKLENLTGEAPTTSSTANGVADASSVRTAGHESVRHMFSSDVAQTSNGSAVDEPELTARVVRSLSTMVNQRGGVMNMRLDPPELGQLRVQMQLNNGTVSATFHATTQHAQQMLEKNMGALRTALEGHGLTVERVTVQNSSSSQQGSFNDDPADRNHSGRQQHDAGGHQSRGRHDGFNRNAERSQAFTGPNEFAAAASFTERLRDEALPQGARRS